MLAPVVEVGGLGAITFDMQAHVRVTSGPRLDPVTLLRAGLFRAAPSPLRDARWTSWHLARIAIWQALRAFSLRPGDIILMPSYNCGSEIDPAVRLGLSVRLYGIRRDLTPDLDQLRELASKGARCLYLTHFFGFPQPLAALGEIADEHGMILIEDCAHGLPGLSRRSELGRRGAAAIFSIRKSLPAPDGGFLLVNRPDVSCRRATGRPLLRRTLGKTKQLVLEHFARKIRAKSPPRSTANRQAVAANRSKARKPPLVGDITFDESRADRPASPISLAIARARSLDQIQAIRASNYNELSARIRAESGVELIRAVAPDGVSPWVLPVLVDKPAEVRDRMLEQGVQAVRVWGDVHPVVDLVPFAESRLLKRHVLGLPVHQDMTASDLDLVATALRHALRERDTSVVAVDHV